jgi:hypothetical protein
MPRLNTTARRVLVGSIALSASLLTTACSDKPTPDATPSVSAPSASPAWLLTSEPADALSVARIKADAKEGDTVVVRGRIGGRAEPMTPGSPVFIIMDLAIPHCGENPADACKTPWDYCCETPEVINANNATVQLVASDDAAAADPAAAGLAPLDEVVIVGIVGPRPSLQVLTIRATGIHKIGG